MPRKCFFHIHFQDSPDSVPSPSRTRAILPTPFSFSTGLPGTRVPGVHRAAPLILPPTPLPPGGIPVGAVCTATIPCLDGKGDALQGEDRCTAFQARPGRFSPRSRQNVLAGGAAPSRVGAPVYNGRMPFSHEVLLEAWARSDGRCECQRDSHGHKGRCDRPLSWTLRGSPSIGWEARRRTSWGTDVMSNCVILCAACGTPQSVGVH